jgi:hypothetical protein
MLLRGIGVAVRENLGGVLQRVVDCKFFVNFKLEVFGGVIVHTLSLPQLKVRGKLLVISQIYS